MSTSWEEKKLMILGISPLDSISSTRGDLMDLMRDQRTVREEQEPMAIRA